MKSCRSWPGVLVMICRPSWVGRLAGTCSRTTTSVYWAAIANISLGFANADTFDTTRSLVPVALGIVSERVAVNDAAQSALSDVDVICFMVDALKWTEGDEHVLGLLQRAGDTPVILLVNKVDNLTDKSLLLPHLESLAARFAFAEVIPVSALRDHNLDVLEKALSSRLPEGDFWFDDDQLTDRSLRFMAAEIIREKVVRQLGQEVPHQITVEIDIWEDGPKVTDIAATILVERRGQKKILIGDKGSRIKSIGTQAREDMERLIDRKVMLTLWVKIKAGWSDDERALRSLGYDHR